MIHNLLGPKKLGCGNAGRAGWDGWGLLALHCDDVIAAQGARGYTLPLHGDPKPACRPVSFGRTAAAGMARVPGDTRRSAVPDSGLSIHSPRDRNLLQAVVDLR